MKTDTQTINQRFQVSYDYPVVFTDGVFEPDNEVLVQVVKSLSLTRIHRVFVCIDSGVAEAWPSLNTAIRRYVRAHRHHLKLVCEPIVLPGGEACKNDPELVTQLLTRFANHGLDRQSFVLAIGGGAVLDMVGYAAAIAHRGIRLIRLPTTVLAQNDAGVGVKNSVNAFDSKNFLGTFCPPIAVLNDIRFISTLDDRDKRAGMAEAVKVALIRDGTFFEWLVDHSQALANFECDAMAYMIRRCAELHLDHIATSGDPFEYGSARPLDFGHWAAHKLEVLTAHALRHGEAVAIGMALDARYSVECGLLEDDDFQIICRLLATLGFDCTHELLGTNGPDGRLMVLSGLEEFRQHLGGELTVTLLTGLGEKIEVNEIDEALLIRSVDYLAMHVQAA
ncbi:MAG: 3-dehydroquinate synthase [Myxococcota bacterium]|nr:3-dehydroquinate synthase [Myxococcota bacterium]